MAATKINIDAKELLAKAEAAGIAPISAVKDASASASSVWLRSDFGGVVYFTVVPTRINEGGDSIRENEVGKVVTLCPVKYQFLASELRKAGIIQ
jgi:hypothetical protein